MESDDGYWGPPTSTVDWCESNYTVTKYCAELVNASTNIIFIYLGSKGIMKYRHDPILLICYIGYITVGVGSLLFHATLKYPMQLLDELPMIWTASILLYASLSQSAYEAYLSIGLTVTTIGFTILYLYVANPNILFITFGILLLAILVINLRKRSVGSDNEIISSMKWIGISLLVFGFACWILDRHFCSTLQAWREVMGQPWAILLELHGWWHLAMGICCNFATLWVMRLRKLRKDDRYRYRLAWTGMFPWLEPINVNEKQE